MEDRMNKTQRTVLFAVAAAIVVMVVFPPWGVDYGDKVRGLGYSFLFDRPHHAASITVSVLLLQMFAAGAVGGILFFAFSGERSGGGKKGVIAVACVAIVVASVGFGVYSKKKNQEIEALKKEASAPQSGHGKKSLEEIFGIDATSE